jgi:putative Ca2+/H+ antiporter (TMEM165/GDT1 family)
VSWRLFAQTFGAIFLAELGDKTQLATLLFASGADNPKWTVFFGAASALVVTSAIGVLAGAAVSSYVSPRALQWVAGVGFIAIGVLTISRA